MASFKRIKRSLPFFKVLLRSRHQHRLQILKMFPTFVMDDIIEILINIVRGNVKLPLRYSKTFRRQQKPLLNITHGKGNTRRKIFYKQKGGFISAVLPVVARVISSLLGSAL